ncbi:MAG: hypothetical protein ACR2PM_20515 [Hyphomicrobiales bacterium]
MAFDRGGFSGTEHTDAERKVTVKVLTAAYVPETLSAACVKVRFLQPGLEPDMSARPMELLRKLPAHALEAGIIARPCIPQDFRNQRPRIPLGQVSRRHTQHRADRSNLAVEAIVFRKVVTLFDKNIEGPEILVCAARHGRIGGDRQRQDCKPHAA